MDVGINWFIKKDTTINKWFASKDCNFDKSIEMLEEPEFINGYLLYTDPFTNKSIITNEFIDIDDYDNWYNGVIIAKETFYYYRDNDTNLYYITKPDKIEFIPWRQANEDTKLDIDFVNDDDKLIIGNYLCIRHYDDWYISTHDPVSFYYIPSKPANEIDAHTMYVLSKNEAYDFMEDIDAACNNMISDEWHIVENLNKNANYILFTRS